MVGVYSKAIPPKLFKFAHKTVSVQTKYIPLLENVVIDPSMDEIEYNIQTI